MKHNKSGNKRRQLLKTAALTGGLAGVSGLTADKWVKPLVSSVVLPVHAQTSSNQRFIILGFNLFGSLNQDTSKSEGLMIANKIKDLFIPPVYAQVEESIPLTEIYLDQISETLFKCVITATLFTSVDEIDYLFASAILSGEIEVGEEAQLQGKGCVLGEEEPTSISITLLSVSLNNEATIQVMTDSGSELVTLQFAPNATEPEYILCEVNSIAEG